MVSTEHHNRWRVHAAWALALLLAVGIASWATSVVVNPSGDQAKPETAIPKYTAETGEIGVTTSVQANIVFQPGPSGTAGQFGTITSINIDPAKPIKAGDVLFTVDLRPAVVAKGATPAFRDLSYGVRGPDVRQLRQFLGLTDADVFDGATWRAVAAWQKKLGVTADGVVHRGDILFLGSLPTRGYPLEGIEVGSPITAGQAAVATVLERPLVTVAADGAGAKLAAGMAASMTVGGVEYKGVLSGPSRGTDGLLSYSLTGEDGLSVCTAECAIGFPVTGGQVSVGVDLVPRVSGVVIPDSAIAILPDSSTSVRAVGGKLIAVKVVASGQGLSVVEGLEAGTVIELFADDKS